MEENREKSELNRNKKIKIILIPEIKPDQNLYEFFLG